MSVDIEVHRRAMECGELLTALARERRGRCSRSSVEEEIADVLLVCLGAVNESVLKHLERKVARLKGRAA